MAIEDVFELTKILKQSGDRVQQLRQFEAARSERVARVFRVSRQVGQLGQAAHPIACFLRDGLYKLLPPALGDRQFRWLFDYHPQW
jgi:2-polyprenyl-6-methoxyphenol hydroxylase-like FAD-dependent oxidoreductase